MLVLDVLAHVDGVLEQLVGEGAPELARLLLDAVVLEESLRRLRDRAVEALVQLVELASQLEERLGGKLGGSARPVQRQRKGHVGLAPVVHHQLGGGLRVAAHVQQVRLRGQKPSRRVVEAVHAPQVERQQLQLLRGAAPLRCVTQRRLACAARVEPRFERGHDLLASLAVLARGFLGQIGGCLLDRRCKRLHSRRRLLRQLAQLRQLGQRVECSARA